MDIIRKASEYTYCESDKKFIRNLSKGKLPKYITIDGDIMTIKRKKFSGSINLVESNPAKIATFISKAIRRNEVKGIPRIPELPAKIMLHKIKSNSIVNSLIFDYSCRMMRKCDSCERERQRLESFVHFHIINGNIDKKNITVIDSEIDDIEEIHIDNSFNFSIHIK